MRSKTADELPDSPSTVSDESSMSFKKKRSHTDNSGNSIDSMSSSSYNQKRRPSETQMMKKK